MIINEEKRMLTVTDDWFPCYPNSQVELRVALLNYNQYYLKLSAWGLDDTGVEIELDADNEEDGMNKYKMLKWFFDSIPDGVDRYWFYDHGFIPS